jgi:hypothetical protein
LSLINEDRFGFFLANVISFVSFLSHIALAGIFKQDVKNSGNKKHIFGVVSDISRKACDFSQLSMILAIGSL